MSTKWHAPHPKYKEITLCRRVKGPNLITTLERGVTCKFCKKIMMGDTTLVSSQPTGLTFDVKHIEARIDLIREFDIARDYERVHSEVENLYHDSLLLIRDGKFANPAEIAATALKVEKIFLS